VLANVTFALELKARPGRRLRKKATRALATELLDLVGLAGFEKFYPAEISGGMQQRANLARALAIRPSLLLMDEPFSALDAQTREELQVELQRIALEAATTIVFVTHDIREAAYLADRVVVLGRRPGRVREIVDIPTPRPRPSGYQVSAEFIELTNHIWHLVHDDTSGHPESHHPDRQSALD
jgi:NitT/TauT family transport system ATP-binding protein